MKTNMSSLLIIFCFCITLLINGCIITGDPLGINTRINCNPVIDYQARKINITGFEYPIELLEGDVKSIKVAGVDIDKKSIRKASEQVKMLDLIQYRACQDSFNTRDSKERKFIRERRDKSILLIIDTLNELKNNINPSEKSIEDNKEFLEGDVMRETPIHITNIPEFPFPPPNPSTSVDIPPEYLKGQNTPINLQDIFNRLVKAFEQAEYREYSWYMVPEGFALVSRLEKFNYDGTSKQGIYRWLYGISDEKKFSLQDYIISLFKSSPGYYRVIVFLVSYYPYGVSVTPDLSTDDAQKMLKVGVSGKNLPDRIGNLNYSYSYYTRALIYQFERLTENHKVKLTQQSHLPGRVHLEQAKLWSALRD